MHLALKELEKLLCEIVLCCLTQIAEFCCNAAVSVVCVMGPPVSSGWDYFETTHIRTADNFALCIFRINLSNTKLKGHASNCCESQSNMWVRTSTARFFGITLESIMWVELSVSWATAGFSQRHFALLFQSVIASVVPLCFCVFQEIEVLGCLSAV